MGRSVANEEFLRALLRRDPFDAYHFFLPDQQQGKVLGKRLQEEFSSLWENGKFFIASFQELPEALGRYAYHCFHLSDCLTHNAHLAALRNAVSLRCFPITGVTHSLSYARYAPMFLAHMWQGTTSRDAIIATSRAAVAMVSETFLWLREGYHLPESFVAPHIERIPLAVNNDAFSPEFYDGAEARARMGIAVDDVLLLVMARVSHYSKMDIIPLLRALQRLQLQGVSLQKVHVVVAGFVQQGDTTPQTLQQLAEALDITFHLVANPDDIERNTLYAAADCFVSLADNVQETFGLTLLEAGVMGLPVIASDYDGYRDLIVDGETGILIPTIGPEDTSAIDCKARLVFDSATHLELAQQTVVSVPHLADALAQYITFPNVRERMGAAGRKRVLSLYLWDTVIEQYISLWKRLNDTPAETASSLHPLHMPYARLFGRFTSTQVHPEMRVRWSTVGKAVYYGKDSPVVYGGVEHCLDFDVLRQLLFRARKEISIATLAEATQGMDHIRSTLLWALKQDLLEIVHRGE